jgi:hypothetical protein
VLCLYTNFSTQKDAFLVFVFSDIANICYLNVNVYFDIFLNANFPITFYVNVLKLRQVSYFFSCKIWFPVLSSSPVTLLTFSSFISCLRRSFREKCLNNIETNTRFKFLKSFKVDPHNWTKTCLTNTNLSNALFLDRLKVSFINLYLFPIYRKHTTSANLKSHRISRYFAFLRDGSSKLVCLKHLLAQCGDVELNPGPNHNINVNNNTNVNDELVTRPVITIMTQNCRGLNDYNKMRLIIKNKNSMVNNTKMILALQETHLINDDWIKWSGNYVISKAPSPHSAGCIMYFNEDVRIVEVQQIDDQGHGHVVVIEGLLPRTVIFANIYSPVRSLARDQENFF